MRGRRRSTVAAATFFLPLDDRNQRTLRWALAQLRDFRDDPIGFLILNQSRNVQRPLAAYADNVIEMAMPHGLGPTRQRHFAGRGRYPEMLKNATAELNAEGTDHILDEDRAPPQPPLRPVGRSTNWDPVNAMIIQRSWRVL